MAEAVRPGHVPGWEAQAARLKAEGARRVEEGKFARQSFQSLTDAEKNEVLRLVAVRLGIVKE